MISFRPSYLLLVPAKFIFAIWPSTTCLVSGQTKPNQDESRYAYHKMVF